MISLRSLHSSHSHTRILNGGTAANPESSRVRVPVNGKEPSGEWHEMHNFESQETVPLSSLNSVDLAKEGTVRNVEMA